MERLKVILVLLSSLNLSSGLNCVKVAYLQQVGVLSFLGQIDCRAPVATNSSGWVMRMEFSQPFTGMGVWGGIVNYNGTERWAEIRNRDESDAVMNVGDEKCMRFRMNFGHDGHSYIRPRVLSFKFQGNHEMCEAWKRKRYHF